MRAGESTALFSASDPVTTLLVAITWPQLPSHIKPVVNAFLLDAKGQAMRHDSVIGHLKPESQHGLSPAGPGIFRLDLPNMPIFVQRIAFALSLQDDIGDALPLSDMGEMKLEVRTPQRGVIATFRQNLIKTTQDTVLPGMVYRQKGKTWRFKALGQGLRGGPSELCKRLGIRLEAEEPASDSPRAPDAQPARQEPVTSPTFGPASSDSKSPDDDVAPPRPAQAAQEEPAAADASQHAMQTNGGDPTPTVAQNATEFPEKSHWGEENLTEESYPEESHTEESNGKITAHTSPPSHAPGNSPLRDGLRSFVSHYHPSSFLLQSIVLLCGFIFLIGDGLPIATLPIRGDVNLVDITDWRMVVLPLTGLLVIISVFAGRIHQSWIVALPIVALIVQTLWEVWQHAQSVELEAIRRFGSNDYAIVHHLVYHQPTNAWGMTLLGVATAGLIIASITEALSDE